MLNRHTLVAIAAATGLSLGGIAFGQENTRPGQNPLEPPRNANPDDRRTPNSGAADMGDRAGSAASGAMGGAAADAKAAQNIRSLANDPMAGDKLFAMMAATDNLWEVQFNQLVAERAQTREIKEHARMIAQDHQQAQQRLEAIGQKNNVMLPSSLPAEKQAKLEVFRSMPVDKLETCWLTEMRAGHAKAITSYADHTKTLQNEELRTYTSEALPKLRQHGAEVNRIAATKGLGTGAAGGAMDQTNTGGNTGGTTGNNPANPAGSGMGNTGNTGAGQADKSPTMNH